MRSTNDGGHAIELAVHSPDEEMAALDALGPVTRQAIYDSPIRYSALPILKQVLDFEEEQRQKLPEHLRAAFRIDPKDPRLDLNIARDLREDSLKTILKDRSAEDANAGVIPLRARYSVKSIREQRRSLRKIRW